MDDRFPEPDEVETPKQIEDGHFRMWQLRREAKRRAKEQEEKEK